MTTRGDDLSVHIRTKNPQRALALILASLPIDLLPHLTRYDAADRDQCDRGYLPNWQDDGPTSNVDRALVLLDELEL